MNNPHPADTEWGRALDSQEVNHRWTTIPDQDKSWNEEVDIAIVGGGLAGLAAAIGLTRNLPESKIRVYERSPKLRSISQGMLAVHPYGLAALESLHPQLPQKVEAMGCPLKVCRLVSIRRDGVPQENTNENYGEETRQNYGRYTVLITWHHLQSVLANMLDNPNDIIRTDHSLVSFTEEKDAVVLHFENQRSVRAKTVVACDGTYSAARRQMIKDSPIYFGQLNWNALIETKQLPDHVHRRTGAVQYYIYQGSDENDSDCNIPRWTGMLNDAGNGYAYWQIRISDPAKALALSGSHGKGGLGLAGVKESLVPLASPSPDIQGILQAIPEEEIFERAIVGLLPTATWRSNNGLLALCGDSAHGMHPSLGLGANSAFGSVAVLVDEMDRHQPHWKHALEAYEMRRKPTADLVQRLSNAVGISESTGSEVLPRSATRKMMDWALQYDCNMDPPQDVVDLLNNFDPLQESGVSQLW